MDSQHATQLVEDARRGDKVAANYLVETFYEHIYAFLRRLCSSDADAADLTQRTFSKVWQSLGTYAGKSSVSTWIHGIAHHVYVDWRRTQHHLESRPDEWWLAHTSDDPAPDETAIRSDLAKALYSAVDRLDPDLRETVHLHYYQGLTLQQTADAQGVATSTIKYRLRQALPELRKAVAGEPVRSSAQPTSKST